jgi:hypothetical protein
MFPYSNPGPLFKCAESIVDNLIRSTIAEPAIGSVVYCSLAMGYADHSGIYVGRNEIAHLDGSGLIELVTPAQFMNRLDGFNLAISITVSSTKGSPVGDDEVAQRARRKIGQLVDYNLLRYNCHTFSSSCVSGRSGAGPVTLTGLKRISASHLGSSEWRVWDQSRTPALEGVANPASGTFSNKVAATSVIAPTAWPFPTSSRP